MLHAFRPTAELLVVDLTARVGTYALAQLKATDIDPRQLSWLGLRLGQAARPSVDWHRPATPSDFEAIQLHGREPVLLVGPGSLFLIRHGYSHWLNEGVVAHAYVAPNAVVEKFELRAACVKRPGLRIHELPSSQEQVLWLCLLEQFHSLLTSRGARSAALLSTLEELPMSSPAEAMAAAMKIEGATAVALVDYRSGMLLAQAGGGLNLELAAAGNTDVVRSKLKTLASLGLKDSIEDILITLSTQYHLIRLSPHHPGLFLYLVLDKERGNLALARYRLLEIERSMRV